MGCYNHNRLEQALTKADVLPLNRCSRYVLFSDCHRGTGTVNDNFLKNKHLYMAAMGYYSRKGYYYLELGDGEELWENCSLQKIMDYHKDVYELFEQLKMQDKIVRLYGNHDMELRKDLPEALCLVNQEGGRNVYLLHGHQVDFFNAVCWRLARFLVRYFWKPLERVGVQDPTSAAKNYKKAQRYEKCLIAWTRKHDEYLIAGHSHRPRLPEGQERYANTGSCVHPEAITCIELDSMQLRLIRWSMQARADLTLCVKREIIGEPINIE